MRLQQLSAVPSPAGNCIHLHWQNPFPEEYPGVRVVRREDTHPLTINDGIVVAEGEGLTTAEDSNLKGETVYYYTLFPYGVSPRRYYFDPRNRTSAIATAPYSTAGQMADLLPAIYHRYDAETNQLRRFLDLPGTQLDQFYSFATALLNAYNLDRIEGNLLPLLAEWIGWQTNYRLEIAKQRNEIRDAPYLYQAMGLIPTLEATVKRILGWESRTKEFVHNIFRSNCPERLNLWFRYRDRTPEWSQPSTALSLNFAYESRPCAVRDPQGTIWMFYHTLKQNRWEVWYKVYIRDASGEVTWTPSQPLNNQKQTEKNPTAALQGSTLWVFWSTLTTAANRWQIHYRTLTNQQWSTIQTLGSDRDDRRQPWAVTDSSNGLWLFWIELTNGQQTLKYNRQDGSNWQLTEATSFALPTGQNPQINDFFALSHPTDTTQPLWVFWARQEPADSESQTRWQIAYRTKQGLDPTVTTDWSEVRTLPWTDVGIDDREPSALVRTDGTIELFWSSTRSGSWSIWHASLDPTNHTWSTAVPITTGPYTHRAPLCWLDADRTLLIYRSNQSLSYTSKRYGATKTTDFRYAGCTSVDTRNLTKLKSRDKFDNFQTYTSVLTQQDRPTHSEQWYAWYARRNTAGLYLTPTTGDPQLLQRDQILLKNALPQFLPIPVEVEFFPQLVEVEEHYDTLQAVQEVATDLGVLVETERYREIAEVIRDRIPGWQLFRTNSLDHLTVNVTPAPIAVRSRTWHAALTYE